MIVVDASAMVEALLGAAPTDELLAALEGDVHAPTLLDVEVMSALRGLELGTMLSPAQATEALDTYWSFSIQRHEAQLLRHRVWQLRHQFTCYDAQYIALAQALDAPLYTCDRKLAARSHCASVLVQR